MESASPDKPSKCPECGSKMSRCLETRTTSFGGETLIIRVRKCGHCCLQFRTKQIKTPETMCNDDIPLPHRNKGDTPTDEEIARQKKEAQELANNPIPEIPGIDEDAVGPENKQPPTSNYPEDPHNKRRRQKRSDTSIFPEAENGE